MIRVLFFLCLFLVATAWAQNSAAPGGASARPQQQANVAGTVVLAEGEVAIIGTDQLRRTVNAGETVREGESIVTGKTGELHLRMEDGGYIAVRPNTNMKITRYQANGDASDSGIFGLLSGSFRSITGWIGKFNRDRYVVRTPTATIGIRGTDHEPFVIPSGSREGTPGTYDKVNAGASFIASPGGGVEIAPGQAGFAPTGAKAAPVLLDRVPAFFRETRNENLLAGMHDSVQQNLDSLRDSRQGSAASRGQQSSTSGGVAGGGHAKVNVQDVRQNQSGLLNKQQLGIGNAVVGGKVDATVKGVSQAQTGLLNQQKANIGNAD